MGAGRQRRMLMTKSEESKILENLSGANEKELLSIIMKQTREDPDFRTRMLAQLDARANDAEFTEMKHLCEQAIADATDESGHIVEAGEPAVVDAFARMLMAAQHRLQKSEVDTALEMTEYVVGRLDDLHAKSKSSFGAEGLLEEVVDIVKKAGRQSIGSPEAHARWAERLIEMATSSVAVDTGAADDLLAASAPFADASNSAAFFVAVDEIGNSTYSRLALIRRLEGEDAARTFERDHVGVDAYRMDLIQQARDAGRFAEAEELCAERMKGVRKGDKEDRARWTAILRGIRAQAALWKKKSEEEDRRPKAPASIFKSRWRDLQGSSFDLKKLCDMERAASSGNVSLANVEDEGEFLMDVVRSEPGKVFALGPALYSLYPEEITQVAVAQIRTMVEKANNRSVYQRIADDILILAKMGAPNEAARLLEDLRAEYPRKQAFLEELDVAWSEMTASSAL